MCCISFTPGPSGVRYNDADKDQVERDGEFMKSSKYQDRRFFDEDKIPSDVWSVLRASSVLSVGEFRIFEIAYEAWHGEAGEEKMIEEHFIGYMFNDIVPPWVRHFCKKVMKQDNEGSLDPEEFGIIRKAATTYQINKGLEAMMWIIGFMIVLFLVGEGTSQALWLQCMFPPCY